MKTIVLALTLIGGLSLSHGVIINEPFDSPVGSLPDGWTAAMRKDAENNRGAIQVSSIPGAGINALRIQRAGSLNDLGALFYSGTAGGVSGGKIQDFTASVKLRFATVVGSTVAGMSIRADELSFSHNGYFIGVNPGRSVGDGFQPTLGIWKDPQGHVMRTTPVENGTGEVAVQWASIAPLSNNIDYMLKVVVIGDTLEASLWALDDNSSPSVELGTVGMSGIGDAAGYFALRAGYGSDSVVYFRDLELDVSAIPENSNIAWVLGLLSLASILWARSRLK